MPNRPERLAWFAEKAFGMFIHWSVDAPLGAIVSHSMVGASDDYLRRYVEELPALFAAEDFQPRRWARLARTAGMRYVVFTAKHHNGFCMWDTQTTDFNVMNTPLGRDVVGEVLAAFRAEGIATGLYVSPDDWWWCWQNGIAPSRLRPESAPSANPGMRAHNQAQLRELLTRYGTIDVLFYDIKREAPTDLNELAWTLQPETIITRGAMQTPEQRLPDEALPRPWEACCSIGRAWQHRPTNDEYKTGRTLIEMLIETRAKGGNLLLNVGPDAEGRIPAEQANPLRELALWRFVNDEAVYRVQPWDRVRSDGVWFARSTEADVVYAFCTGEPWPPKQWREVTLPGVDLPDGAEVELLGQSGRVVEYAPDLVPKARWKRVDGGVRIRAMRAPRLYNSGDWPNPATLRLPAARTI